MRLRFLNRIGLILLIVALTVSGCYRGRPSDKPPVHLVPNMDSQEKVKPYSQNELYDNGSGMRMPLEGTVARGELYEDTEYYMGMDRFGNFVKESPVPLSVEQIRRGRERFDIFCSMCHGRVGDARGIVVEKGLVPPPSFHIERIRQMPDGEIFNIITNGIRNMPSYKHQIPAKDRWAIIHYFRILQRSQNAEAGDLPENVKRELADKR